MTTDEAPALCSYCGQPIGHIHVCNCTFAPDISLVIVTNPRSSSMTKTREAT